MTRPSLGMTEKKTKALTMFVAGNWSEGGGTPASVEHAKGLSFVHDILAYLPRFVKGGVVDTKKGYRNLSGRY